MERKSNNIILYVLITIVALVIGIGIGCLVTLTISKNDATNKEAASKNEVNTVIADIGQNKEFRTSDFVISKVEKTVTGYDLYVYLLAETNKKVTEKEVTDIRNGGTFRFRGRDWIFGRQDEEFIQLKEKDTGMEGIGLRAAIVGNEYEVYNVAGNESKLRDYMVEGLSKIQVKDNVKCGDTFEKFDYDQKTQSVTVRNFNDDIIPGETIREFVNRMEACYNNPTRAGECTAYSLNGEVVAIQSHVATGP